eukprot:COSAG01_NODE_13351_length_1597_cov_1.198264_1_plen_30_part_10
MPPVATQLSLAVGGCVAATHLHAPLTSEAN